MQIINIIIRTDDDLFAAALLLLQELLKELRDVRLPA